MSQTNLMQAEAYIDELSLLEQLSLMTWLAQRIREKSLRTEAIPNDVDINELSLIDMANDPNIQREIRAISAEFAVAQTDGLDHF